MKTFYKVGAKVTYPYAETIYKDYYSMSEDPEQEFIRTLKAEIKCSTEENIVIKDEDINVKILYMDKRKNVYDYAKVILMYAGKPFSISYYRNYYEDEEGLAAHNFCKKLFNLGLITEDMFEDVEVKIEEVTEEEYYAHSMEIV